MASMLQWFVVPALAAIGRHVKRAGTGITAARLSTWTSDAQLDFPPRVAEAALQTLWRHGFVAPASKPHVVPRSTRYWVVTFEGVHAAQAALLALPDAPGPDVQSLSVRLWNLLRIRRRLTAMEAAQTLIDAGDDFAMQTRRIAAQLAAWARHSPTIVVVAGKRESGRHLRYVLLNDLGRWPAPSRAGEMHPSRFARVQATPACYLKNAVPTERAIEKGGMQ
ncbi:hypothetical protein [Ottowia sp.]|uniref:hypothetical protein n=1 Tax=Ottowia sp. TaxID=1898956 RepID=UPI0025EB79E4|nr:hypothetical protein [Ottowia sp.]